MATSAAGTRTSIGAPLLRASVFRASPLFGDRVESFFRKLWVLRHRQSRLDQFFYAADLEGLIRRRNSYGVPFMPCAAGSAYSMDIIFRVLRQIIIYYELYSHDVYSARRYIGSDEYPVFTGFKTCERFFPLSERTV